MTKKALLVGVNTMGLKYCDHDAELMADCLTGHDYEVVRPNINKIDFIKAFDALIDDCNKTDTLLLYFSGHGIVERGYLYFPLVGNGDKQGYRININELVNSFAGCKAESKLLILDCCNAGTGSADWKPESVDRYRIMTASDRLEKSKEIDVLKASFLTYHLHRALAHTPPEIISPDGKIRVNDLGSWLEEQAKKHNNVSNAIQVPIPNLLGNQKANIELVTVDAHLIPVTKSRSPSMENLSIIPETQSSRLNATESTAATLEKNEGIFKKLFKWFGIGKKKTGRVLIVMNGTIPSEKEQMARLLIKRLRDLSDDITLDIEEIKPGSIRLVVRGTEEGLDNLRELLKQGKLDEMLEYETMLLQKLPEKRFPRMVRWYTPNQIRLSLKEKIISSFLGRYVMRRVIEATNRPSMYFDYSFGPDSDHKGIHNGIQGMRLKDQVWDKKDLWIDFVSNLGDGWNSTYAIASLLAKEKLQIEGVGAQLHRGNILVFGGNTISTLATREEYENRLIAPYKAASSDNVNPPYLFALPGNYDWSDNLSLFSQYFVDIGKCEFAGGGWRVEQNRSYFALKLPQGWWLLSVDVQLQSEVDLDPIQYKYFESVVSQMNKGDRVIMCSAEPYWMYNRMYKSTQERYENSNLKRLMDLIDPKNIVSNKQDVETTKGKRIALYLAGDSHHYFRVVNHEEQLLSLTVGGGGAFLHPTHGLVNQIINKKDMKAFNTCAFPSPAQSWRLGWLNLLFPIFNFSFGIIPGFLYLLLSWLMTAYLGIEGVMKIVPPIREPYLLPEAITATIEMLYAAAITNPPLTFCFFVFVVACARLGRSERFPTQSGLFGGILHGVVHIYAATIVCVLGVAIFKYLTQQLGLDSMGGIYGIYIAALCIFGLGWIVGSCLMGFYLFISLNIFGHHGNAAFSALRIEDWKNFLRMKLDLETGELTLYPLGIIRVPRKWKRENRDNTTYFQPGDGEDLKATLIEGPICITPIKKGTEISFKSNQMT